MNTLNARKIACAAVATAMCALTLCGCSSSDEANPNDPYDTSAGVAAEINGHQFGEGAITNQVAMFRTQNSLEADEDWAQWLVDNDLTPSDVREILIDDIMNREIIILGAEENGIVADENVVESQVSYMKAQFNDDATWNQALQAQGLTEDDYREMIRVNLLTKSLIEKVAPATEPTDEELLENAQLFAQMYTGAKKSSHILFSFEDEELAKTVLDQIRSGEITFEDAVTQYSTDEGSKVNQGDVGWDKMSSFVPEYTAGLSSLEKGEVSDLVKSEFGYHIIKCTDVFNVEGEVTSLDQIPTEFIQTLTDQLMRYSIDNAFSQWAVDYKTNADITINEIPVDVPYNVDLSGYTKSDPVASSGSQASQSDQPNETK